MAPELPPPPITDPSDLPVDKFTGGARIVRQRPRQARRRPAVRDQGRLPGYMSEVRVEEQWEGSETTGSQYGHPNDGAHAWVWI